MTTCTQCKINFTPRRDTKGLFCSYECYWKSKKGVYPPHMIDRKLEPKLCHDCNKTLDRQAHYKNVRRCWGCYCKWIKANPQFVPTWKGGITDENHRLRNSKEYALWRTAVFERDDYTCQDCLERGGRLEADHIKAWSTHPKLRFKLSNGRTLCHDCHTRTPNYGYRKINLTGLQKCR